MTTPRSIEQALAQKMKTNWPEESPSLPAAAGASGGRLPWRWPARRYKLADNIDEQLVWMTPPKPI